MLIREGDNVADLLPVEDMPRQAVRPEVGVCFDPFRPVVCRHEENAARAKDASDFPDKHGEVNAVLDCRDRDRDIELAGSAQFVNFFCGNKLSGRNTNCSVKRLLLCRISNRDKPTGLDAGQRELRKLGKQN